MTALVSRCLECGAQTRALLPHAIGHAPAGFAAILCQHCPPDQRYGVAWQPSRLSSHTKNRHPGQPISFIDKRPFFQVPGLVYSNLFPGPSEIRSWSAKFGLFASDSKVKVQGG